ncbi:MAG TPA: NUDIX hydrolase [Rhizomicrobium sp.]|nr:NUDIX hydrolase [Rhizomicrobium sp.]
MQDAVIRGEPLFREHARQVAALCWRAAPALEVLLITSLSTRRWIIPKGWPMLEMTLAESAAREAFEEAGVEGNIGEAPVGNYPYLKERKDGGGMPCSVDVFPLEVTGQAESWPEQGARELAWLPLEDAAAKVAEPGLRDILLAFGRSPERGRRAATR